MAQIAAEPSTQSGGGRRERKAEQTRRRILEAAQKQMALGGPESITIQVVTEGADIGQGTFYNYFETKGGHTCCVCCAEIAATNY